MDSPPTTSATYGGAPDASHGAALSNTLPFVLKLLVCFLVLDGLERVVELVMWAQALPDVPELAPSPYYPNIPATLLWVVVHMLLAILLLLRTWWGRVWTQAIFIIHILFIGHGIVVRHPEIWVYMSPFARSRLLFTVLLDLTAVFYLFSDQARRTLSR